MNDVPPSPDLPSPESPHLPRLAFPIGLIAVYWALYFVVNHLEKPYFFGFLYGMASSLLFAICFLVWWGFNRALRRSEKWLGFAVIVAGAFLAGKFAHRSINILSLCSAGLPLVVTVVVAWLWLVKRALLSPSRPGFAALVLLTWSGFLLVRTDGFDSTLQSQIRWRWTPTAEERFLTQKTAGLQSVPAARPAGVPAMSLSSSNSWPAFRGPDRDGVVHGTKVAAAWKQAPPQLWKCAVGPSWASLIVIDGRLYTQEQRGTSEVAVCHDSSTGREIWAHEDAVRFDEPVSGAGPRATPSFAEGRVLTFGATGILNCLDSQTGKLHWSRDIKNDSQAKLPLWGFSSSPLIVDGKVIVYGGGEAGKSLAAYRLDSGELAWTAAAGQSSYSSAQITSLAGVPQCLMLHDFGLTSFDPATGKKLWETGLVQRGAPRCGQPRLIDETKLVVSTLDGTGTSLIDVSKSDDQWKISPVWISKDLKTEFPDFVVHGGYAYGFDISIFCCLNLSTGKRSWKEGRYGRGQVILLADQALLLVISESGEAILLAADPHEQKELGRFQALNGKTWNHPVIGGGRLFLRNAEEMACYALEPEPPAVSGTR